MQRTSTSQPAVDCLPAEILGHVLVIYANDTFENWIRIRHGLQIIPDSLYIAWHGTNPYNFFNVTLVCRRWRKIALECPGFWSNIVVGPETNVKLLLNRSKDHALHIFCLVSDILGLNRRHAVLSLALTHLHRVRSLQLILRPQDEGREPLILFAPSHAPLLDFLSVHFAEARGGAHVPQTPNQIREIGAKWDAPRLRHLKYYGGTDYALPLSSFPPAQSKSTLTHLVWLPGGPTHSTSLISCAEDLLSALRSLPQLETLHVAFAKDSSSRSLAPSVSPVRLPRLRQLLLDGHIDTCVELLEHLDFKEPLQQFAVMARQESQRREDIVPLPEYLADLFQAQATVAPAAHDRPLRTLCIRPDTTADGTGVQIMGWESLQAPTRFPMDTNMLESLSQPGYADLALCHSLPDALPRAHLDRFLRHMRFDGVQSLQLGIAELHDNTRLELGPAWVRPAARLTAVETLAFALRAADPAQLEQHLLYVREGGRAARYPALKHLYVTDLFPERQYVDDSEQFVPKGTWDTFVDTIVSLIDDSVRLEKLTLKDPIVPLGKADLMELRQLVPSVMSNVVDGMQKLSLGKTYLVPEYMDDQWVVVEDELKWRP
ncbi:hypothetical protein PsYK624_040530 [Phanerochaete sordida]|uniref:F-box domain-containing protein n=1 Tax=Phanerochaete sordida TaxID=48140 RepID=A0A9P3LAA6_9APHY|nr:hypothetical protein PsYK624_040530 [Phanerochaete sordida]